MPGLKHLNWKLYCAYERRRPSWKRLCCPQHVANESHLLCVADSADTVCRIFAVECRLAVSASVISLCVAAFGQEPLDLGFLLRREWRGAKNHSQSHSQSCSQSCSQSHWRRKFLTNFLAFIYDFLRVRLLFWLNLFNVSIKVRFVMKDKLGGLRHGRTFFSKYSYIL